MKVCALPALSLGRWLPLAIVAALLGSGFSPPCGAARLAVQSEGGLAPGRPTGDAPPKAAVVQLTYGYNVNLQQPTRVSLSAGAFANESPAGGFAGSQYRCLCIDGSSRLLH